MSQYNPSLCTRRRIIIIMGTLFSSSALAKTLGGLEFSSERLGNLPTSVGKTFLSTKNFKTKLDEVQSLLKTSLTDQELINSIHSRIEQDFLTNSCFSHEQWVFSTTEGALCALLNEPAN